MNLLPDIKDNKLIIKKPKNKRNKEWKKYYKKRRQALKKIEDNNQKVKKTYKAYIRSKEWKKRKEVYWAKHPKVCVACKSDYRIALHHLKYNTLYREKDEDLAPLCWNCHQDYHAQHGCRDLFKKTNDFIIEKQEMLMGESSNQ